jgi:hypothetical protein
VRVAAAGLAKQRTRPVNTFAWEAGKCSGLDKKLCELRQTGDKRQATGSATQAKGLWGVGLDGRE